MYKIDSEYSENGHFSDGDYEVGKKGTRVPAKWLNSVQDEICNLVEFLGLELSEDDDQILNGLNAYMNGYFTRQYIEEYIDNVSETSQDAGSAFSVPYKGIVDIDAVLSLFDVVGNGRITVSVYDTNNTFVNSAVLPVSEGEELKILVRLLAKNDDPNGNARNFKMSAVSSAGCSASGRITFVGSVISKRINYAQD